MKVSKILLLGVSLIMLWGVCPRAASAQTTYQYLVEYYQCDPLSCAMDSGPTIYGIYSEETRWTCTVPGGLTNFDLTGTVYVGYTNGPCDAAVDAYISSRVTNTTETTDNATCNLFEINGVEVATELLQTEGAVIARDTFEVNCDGAEIGNGTTVRWPC